MTDLEFDLTAQLFRCRQIFELVKKEFDVMHALCDRAEVPRKYDGEHMTLSQRVATLEGAWRDLRCVYRGSEPPLQQ